MNKINLPQLPEAGLFADYWASDMQAYAIAAVEKDRAERGGVPGAIRYEAAKLSFILREMVEGGYSDLDTLYTEDQADGDAFVKRAAEVLGLLSAAPQQHHSRSQCRKRRRFRFKARKSGRI